MDKKSQEERLEGIARGASSVTIAVFISRVLGLVREQVLAYFFGAGKSMDAFVVAYRIPNLLRDLFAEGASQAAFVKVFSSHLERSGKPQAMDVARILLSNLLLTSGLTVLLLILLAPYLVNLLAPAFKTDQAKYELTVNLTYLVLPFLFFISLSALFAGLLNSLGHFFWPALSSGLFNLSSILVGVFGYFILIRLGVEPIYAMALGVTLGGFLQALFQLPLLLREGFSVTFRPNLQHEAFREVLRLIGPTIIGLSVMQINLFINTYFATSCGEGAISWYSYAFRVMYVPLGLFGVGLTQALLPELTKVLVQARDGGLDKQNLHLAKNLFSRSLILALSLAIPSSAGLFLLSQETIAVLFERGRFSSFDTIMTGSLLAILSLALPFYSLSKTAIPLFYSLGKTYVPVLGSALALLTNLCVIKCTLKSLGVKAIALGTTSSLVIQCLFLLLFSSFFLQGLSFGLLFKCLATIILATSLMIGLILLLSLKLTSPYLLLLAIPLGATLYYFTCRLLGPKETHLILDKLFALTTLRQRS